MRSLSQIAGSLLCAALLAPVAAQPPAELPVRATALLPGEKIVLDGTLSHPAWARAPAFDRFVEKDPVTGAAPSQATRVQVLYSQEALYVGVTALDTEPALIRDPVVRRDQVNRTQDFVVVYVDPIGLKQSAQFFRVNAAGSTGDGIHTAADDSEDFSPDFDWDARVARLPDGKGWTAVLRLPLSSLRYAEGPQREWRFMVARRLPREQFHLFASVLIPRDTHSFIDRLQPLAGLQLPDHQQFLSLRPGLTWRQTRERSGNAPAERKHDVEASLDLKWRPRAELVVDATLNPDFSQIELDVPQLAGNTRFALFYPEKRPFFFESADLLRSPSDAVYTRSFTEPRAGARATWRGQQLGATVIAVDDRGGGLVLLPGTFGTGVAEQPASRALAARFKVDDGAWQWGGVLAARRYDDDRGDNLVAGPDLVVPLPAQWRLRAQLLGSRTTAQPKGSELEKGPATNGHFAIAKFNRQAERSETAITLTDIDGGYRHDSGFVNQVGVRQFVLFQNYGWFGLGSFNSLYATFEAQHDEDRASGQAIRQSLRPGLYASAARNLEWVLEAFPLSRLRTGPGRPWLEERYVYTSLVMTPARWWPLMETDLSLGKLADTADNVVRRGARWNFSSKLRPLRSLELEPSLSAAWLGSADSTAYRESSVRLLGVWHFDARQNLRLINQRTSFRRGEAQDAGRNESLTYTFRHSAGTLLNIGVSRNRGGVPVSQRGSEVFAKLQVDADLVRSGWPAW